MILKDCKTFIHNWKQVLKTKIKELMRTPQLAIIQIGNHEASNRYVRNKIKDCEEVGIAAHLYHFDDDISESDLIFEIQIRRIKVIFKSNPCMNNHDWNVPGLTIIKGI